MQVVQLVCIPKTRAGCPVPASRVTVAVRLTGPCGGTWAIRTSCLNSQKKKCRTSFAKCKRARRNKQGSLSAVEDHSLDVGQLRHTAPNPFVQDPDVECAALPLSVYLAQGWEESVVKNCPSVYNETLGVETYKVPVQRDTWTQTFERVVERVLAQEKAASLPWKSKDLLCRVLAISAKRGPKRYIATKSHDVLFKV